MKDRLERGPGDEPFMGSGASTFSVIALSRFGLERQRFILEFATSATDALEFVSGVLTGNTPLSVRPPTISRSAVKSSTFMVVSA